MTLDQRVRDFLRSGYPGGFSLDAISERLPDTAHNVSNALQRLVDSGKVETRGGFFWYLSRKKPLTKEKRKV